MKKFRCAIYTRKSTEEGLEQDFNSLDAQREACEAYIKSQQHEGWILIEKQYNDGGFSGGNLDRPALKELFNDIKNDRIDIVVVYKVDRLTRSLLDFAKIVELFDAHSASFVSVTQNFNTTTSMGRLTLNILLSFAQFEREVTGERIRDKIAASKKKGMWMGGRVPIGYERKDKKLIIETSGATKVKKIFEKYIELKSVPKLKTYLAGENIRTNTGKNFDKGQLYHILQNKTYTGKIVHKNNVYEGEHAAIIEENLFNLAQDLLQANKVDESRKHNASNSLLAGKIYDDKNNRMTPSYSKTRNKKYRYYVSQPVLKFDKTKAGSVSKLPAEETEKFVTDEIRSYFFDTKQIQNYIAELSVLEQNRILEAVKSGKFDNYALVRSVLEKLTVSREWTEMILSKSRIKKFLYDLNGNVQDMRGDKEQAEDYLIIKREIRIKTGTSKGCNTLIIRNDKAEPPHINETLIKAIVKSFYWHKLLLEGKVKNTKDIQKLENLKDNSYIKQVLNLRFLSPRIIEAILNGTQPRELTVTKLFNIKTLNWKEQEQLIML